MWKDSYKQWMKWVDQHCYGPFMHTCLAMCFVFFKKEQVYLKEVNLFFKILEY